MNYARTHRSCADAFGPYNASSQCVIVAPPDAQMDWQDKLILAACAVAVAALSGMWVMAWLK